MLGYCGIITIKTHTTTQMIVATGLTAIANGVLDDALTYCRMGNGTTPAQSENTGLESPIGGWSDPSPTSGATSIQGLSSPYWFGSRRQYVFPAGSFNQEPLTEIGFFSNLQSTLFSRTIITDTQGNITPISVLPDEELTITYEVRKYSPVADVVTSFTLEGVDHTMTVRAAQATTAEGWGLFEPLSVNTAKLYETDILGGVEGLPVGTSETVSVSSSLIDGEIKTTLNIPQSAANFPTGIGAVVLGNTASGDMYQISFSPKLQKLQGSSLYLRNLLSIAWGNI